MKQEKISVLHIVVRLSIGGIQKWLVQVLETYDQARFKMDVCCIGLRPDLGVLAGDAVKLGSAVYYVSIKNPFLFFIHLRKLILTEKYKVVVVHLDEYAFPPLVVSKLSGVPVIVNMYHNTQPPDLSPFSKIVRRWMRAINAFLSTKTTGCSETTLDNLFPEWRRNPKITPLYYGVSTKRFLEADGWGRVRVREQLGISPDAFVIGHIGRFVPQKNHAAFIRTSKMILQELPSCHFILVGDGPLRPQIETIVVESGLSHSFHFTGIRSDVLDLMKAMDLAYYPSHYEGSPVAFIEAQIAGLPIIANHRPEIEEAICPDNCSYSLVDSADDRAAAERILHLFHQKKLLDEMAKVGQAWALKRFSIEQSTLSLEKLINPDHEIKTYADPDPQS